MIKEKIIGMLVGIFILLLACSERDENESLINSGIMGTEKVNVSLSLSLPELQIEGNTDYRPMSTRATDDKVKAVIENEYRCLVLKEIGGTWYVEASMQPLLKKGERWEVLKIMETPVFNNLQLTLRPGHYQVLAVLNPGSVTWNNNLVPGTIVKNGPDTITHAYTYWFQDVNDSHMNRGERQVSKEIFSGTAEFTIDKTSDVHSPVLIEGATKIAFTRKVAKLRFLLKDHPTGGEEVTDKGNTVKTDYNFTDTQYTIRSTIKVTQEGERFCDGLDCWGKAYYNRKKPTTQMRIIIDTNQYWQTTSDGRRYKMPLSNATIYSPFVLTDTTKIVSYQLRDMLITGQSQSPSTQYVYSGPIAEFKLENNTIQPLVFQATNQVVYKKENNVIEVTLEFLKDESSEELFGAYYECNN